MKKTLYEAWNKWVVLHKFSTQVVTLLSKA
jgi:hypothetical protein